MASTWTYAKEGIHVILRKRGQASRFVKNASYNTCKLSTFPPS
jgi:hypothetical protein